MVPPFRCLPSPLLRRRLYHPFLSPLRAPPPPRPPPSDLWRCCFRFLALDPKIDPCRDPVRCRRCWCFGHTERYCRSSSSRIANPSSSISKISADSASHSVKMPATHSMAHSPGSGQDSSPSFGLEFDVLGHDSDSDSDSGGSFDGDDPNRFPVPPNNHTPNSNSIQPLSASNNSHLQPLNRACSGSGPSVNAAPLL